MAYTQGILGAVKLLAEAEQKKNFIGSIMGVLLRKVYELVANVMPAEPEHVSYFAIAIIITTIIFKLILLPLTLKQSKSTKMMSELNPKIRELQTKYKNDPETLANKQRQLYKEMNYNPLSGCLIMLIQFPIIIGFFSVFRDPKLYAFSDPGLYESISKNFLWIKDLDLPDPYFYGLPLLAALMTYLYTKVMQKGQIQDPNTAGMQNTMSLLGPVMIFLFSRRYAAGLALYWTVSNIFTLVQQLIINKMNISMEEAKKS